MTKGSQTVIDTGPSGPRAHGRRQNAPVINPTPGSVPVEKAQGTIAIGCRKQGYLEAAGDLASEFQAMTFGNILFGGIVGIVVDAASGAMHEYPAKVTITLIPDAFATVSARDEFFERIRSVLEREAAEVKERIDQKCARNDCDRQIAAAEAGKAEKLAEIERRRVAATIAGGS
jgi:hypothetical protein